MSKKLLPNKQEYPAEWYTKVMQLADLADYGPAKGSMIFKPYGYAIWEQMQNAMDRLIKAKGVQNAYFPLLIPMSLIKKEASHIKGFAPELAVVTHGGGEKLEEPLAIRPTSEAIMYNSYAKWIESWRDLPIMMNQWNNVVRWEKRTLPFLRTSEFLWQEGHTAHSNHQEAIEIQEWAMQMYAQIFREWLALDGFEAWKSQSERFAGADTTMSYEALMPSGKALQSATSHDLGRNFSKTFDIKFQDKTGSESFVWQTSWGLSTRSIGGLIMAHGDDNGLRLPPKLAPVQVVIVPVLPKPAILDHCRKLLAQLKKAGVRSMIDDRDNETFGYKLNKWEVKGVPLIFKIGARETREKNITVKRRFDGEEQTLLADNIKEGVSKILDKIQDSMLEASRQYLAAETREAHDYHEFKEIVKKDKGFIKVWWNDDVEIEAKIKAETKAASCCQPLSWGKGQGKDFFTGEPASYQWIFAQSY